MKRVGVVGFPVGHSISPAFQQAAFDALGIPARYERLEVPSEELPGLIEEVRGEEWLGVNVTIPHKESVAGLMDELDPSACRVGAVNTVVKYRGRLIGHNTDVAGFLRGLWTHKLEAMHANAMVLGSGGAARAAVAALVESRVLRVTIVARSTERAAEIARQLEYHSETEIRTMSWDEAAVHSELAYTDLLVNTTPVGMRGTATEGRSPIAPSALRPGLTVYDLVYNPRETPLLAAARAAGAATISGLDMLVCQGAEAFELWTGQAAPVDLMKQAAEEALV